MSYFAFCKYAPVSEQRCCFHQTLRLWCCPRKGEGVPTPTRISPFSYHKFVTHRVCDPNQHLRDVHLLPQGMNPNLLCHIIGRTRISTRFWLDSTFLFSQHQQSVAVGCPPQVPLISTRFWLDSTFLFSQHQQSVAVGVPSPSPSRINAFLVGFYVLVLTAPAVCGRRGALPKSLSYQRVSGWILRSCSHSTSSLWPSGCPPQVPLISTRFWLDSTFLFSQHQQSVAVGVPSPSPSHITACRT